MPKTDMTFCGGQAPDPKWIKAAAANAVILLSVSATMALAQQGATDGAAQPQATPLSIGKLFTFLFLTLGPFKLIVPFAEMTRGRDRAFKRRLALQGTLIAAIGLLAAATTGANTLREWGISVGALQLAAGIVLFLIALKPVLQQYEPIKPEETPEPAASPALSSSKLAFAPLAFPTIVTPYGVAALILAVTLRPGYLPEIFGVTVLVLVLDLLAMLFADIILKAPLVASLLGIVGAVMGLLLVALGVQVSIDALRMLGIT